MSARSVPLAFRQHDHADCVRQALREAKRICADNGSRLTPLRSHVLGLLWENHRPLGAYEILDLLADQPAPGTGRATPASVYRTLDFLREHGLVHRIERRNAYLGCTSPARPHRSQFLICTDCGRALEFTSPSVGSELEHAAGDAGFAISDWTVEVAGRCPGCRGADAS